MARRTRVLHIVQNLDYGGLERILSHLVSVSDPERFEHHILCLVFMGRFAEGLERFATLHSAPSMSRLSMLYPAALKKQIAAIAPDVVHTHSGVWYKASLAARLAKVPLLVHTEHGRHQPDPWHHRLIHGLAARRTDVLVAVSARLADELPSILRVAPSSVVCIPNGIDTLEYSPRADNGRLRAVLGIGRDVPIVGSIGRLEPIKAYDLMIEAFAHFVTTETGREARLVIAGDGSARQALQDQIDALGLSQQAHLLGWRDDIHELHSCFSLFTMSSRSEGTSIGLLEAMSSGLPPVVTDVGGNAAVLGTELVQCLVPFGDAQALSHAWVRSLEDQATHENLRRLARERITQSFDLRAMVHAYERIYESGRSSQPGS